MSPETILWISLGANVVMAGFWYFLNRTNADQERRLKAVETLVDEARKDIAEINVQLPTEFYTKTDIDKMMDKLHAAIRELDKKLGQIFDLLLKRP